MKDYYKLFGSEVLYLLASAVVAGLATLLQIVGRSHIGNYSGFIWSGDEYRYNAFFYILGMALFIGFMITGYKFFLKERISDLSQVGIVPKIIFPVIAVFFSIMILAVIVFCLFLMTGMTDNMRPLWMVYVTGFGWPVFSLILMIVAEVLAAKN